MLRQFQKQQCFSFFSMPGVLSTMLGEYTPKHFVLPWMLYTTGAARYMDLSSGLSQKFLIGKLLTVEITSHHVLVTTFGFSVYCVALFPKIHSLSPS